MYTMRGTPSFMPALGSCLTAARKEMEVHRFTIAKVISEPIILPKGRYYVPQNQVTAIESWLMRLSGGRHIAWMDFKQWCGTIPLRKVPIQMKIKSLNCSSCPWIYAFSLIACDKNVCRICFKDKILLRMMFILSALVLKRCFFSVLLVDWQFSIFHFLQLSSSINRLHFCRWIIINFKCVNFKDILHRHTHPSLCTHELTLAKLISGATQHCRTYPASRWVDVFTPTLSHLGDVCLLAWHSSDLLPPGTFPFSPENPTLPHTWAVSVPSPHAQSG